MRTSAILIAASALAAASGPVEATGRQGAAYLGAGAISDAPVGYTQMCRRHPLFCGQLEGRSVEDVLAQASAPVAGLAATGAAGAASADTATAARAAGTRRAFSASFLERVRYPYGHPLEAGQRPIMGSETAEMAPQMGAMLPAGSLDMTRAYLKHLNNEVNRLVIQRTDYAIYGEAEHWNRPVGQGKPLGDCEDIAIEKRVRLVEAGADPRALALAVVYSSVRGLHTVLVARLDDGDYVLDSLSAKVRRWSDTDYVWLRIQGRDNPGIWHTVSYGAPRAPVASYFGRDTAAGLDGG